MIRAIYVFLGLAAVGWAGPYAPAPPDPASTAVPANSTAIHGWASGVVALTRGPQQVGDPDFSDPASFGTGDDALWAANATPGNPTPVVSLGDGGSITLTFNHPIFDGPGFDFAVFENSFDGSFLELALVEVSSNGSDFSASRPSRLRKRRRKLMATTHPAPSARWTRPT